nr:sulfatase/phosphatase domain-containing protein [Siansivirga zeaxanthinifaciens]
MDFLPTLADFAGVDIASLQKANGEKAIYDGASFARILQGKQKRIERDNLFWHLPGYMDERFSPTTLIQKRIGNAYYKLFYFYETEEFALYNLKKDLGEKDNLLEKPTSKNMKIALKMNADMLAWLKANMAPTGTFIKNGNTVPYPKADAVSKYKQ